MGNCGSTLDCHSEIYNIHSTEPLDVDPDIAGSGVLASFIISAAFAIGAIGIGYFTDSLPRRHLHKIDRVFVRQTRESWLFSKAAPALLSIFTPIKRFLQRSHIMRIHFAPVPREIRSESLLRFLLVNSDQQLVTGLAVLTAGLARRCYISSYEFRIVASLGWFSTTTHLATLTVLSNYFRDHPEVLVIRLVGMAATLVLLGFSVAVSLLTKSTWLREPWQCALRDLQTQGPKGKGIWVSCALLIYIVGAFVSRVTTLVRDAKKTARSEAASRTLTHQTSAQQGAKEVGVIKHDTEEETGFINSYAKLVLWLYSFATDKLPRGPDFNRVLKISLKNAEAKRDAIFDSAASDKDRSWLSYADLLSVDYCNSFVFGYSLLIFAFAFGVAQIIEAQDPHNGSRDGIKLNSQVSEWGFGQIVPLFLLGLPLLAAGEIYFESRRKAHSHFYALAIAEGDAEAAATSMSPLARTDTMTPVVYTTFLDSPNVKYGLRTAVWLSTGALGLAGAGIETASTQLGNVGIVIIVVTIVFSLYATVREVYLAYKGMLEVMADEKTDVSQEVEKSGSSTVVEIP